MSDFMDGSLPAASTANSQTLLAVHFTPDGTPDAALATAGPYVADRYSMFAGPQTPLLSQSNGSAADLALSAFNPQGTNSRDQFYGFGSPDNLISAMTRIVGQELQSHVDDKQHLGQALENYGDAMLGLSDALGQAGANFFQTPALFSLMTNGVIAKELGEALSGQPGQAQSAVNRALHRGLDWSAGNDAPSDANDLIGLLNGLQKVPEDTRDDAESMVSDALDQTLDEMSPEELGKLAGSLKSLPPSVREKVEDAITKALDKSLKDADPDDVMQLLLTVKDMPPALKEKITEMAAKALEESLKNASGKDMVKLLAKAQKLPPVLRSEIETIVEKALESAMKKMTPEQIGALFEQAAKLPPGVKNQVENQLVVAFFHLIDETRDPQRLGQLMKALGNAPPSIQDKIVDALGKALEKMLANASPSAVMSILKSLAKLPPQLLAKLMPIIVKALKEAFSHMSPQQLKSISAQADSLPAGLASVVRALVKDALKSLGVGDDDDSDMKGQKKGQRNFASFAAGNGTQHTQGSSNGVFFVADIENSQGSTLIVAGGK